MHQAIAGAVASGEVTVMTVWPSIAASGFGRWIGRMCRTGGQKNPFAIGKLYCLLMIPPALVLYFAKVIPPFPMGFPYKRRYRLTNRRVVEEADRMSWRLMGGFFPVPVFHFAEVVRSLDLDQFDAIDVDVLPGQEWFPAGDLIFRKSGTEMFRLAGIVRPEPFRRTLLAASQSFVYVKRDMAAQA